MEKAFEIAPVSVDCHPTNRLIGIGFIDGSLSISSYKFKNICKVGSDRKRASTSNGQTSINSNSSLILQNRHIRRHKRAIRNLQFTPINGDRLMVITQNRALCQWDVETGRKIRCIRTAHDDPPFALHCVNDDQTVTGDESGVIKLWDWRINDGTGNCAATFDDVHADIVNDLTASDDSKLALAVSGDGTMSVVNLKTKTVQMQSEEMHAELLSVTITKNGQKVICGSGEGGYVEIFNWNEFANITERMQTGHVDSVDRLINIDQTGLVASASTIDGTIRLLRFGPNSSLDIIGRHCGEDNEKMGVQDIALTGDGSYLVSCGEDQKVKFFNLEPILNRFCSRDDSEDEEREKDESGSKIRKKGKKTKSTVASFFDELGDEDADDGGSDETDSGDDE